jgi:hypothetical protein
MTVSHQIFLSREGNVDNLLLHFSLSDGAFHFLFGHFQHGFDFCSCIINHLADFRAFFCRHIFHALQHFRKGAFLSKGIHPDLIELIKGSCGLHLFPDLFLDLFQSVLHNKLLPVLNRSAADKLWGFVLFCGFTGTKKSPA